ncbi:MAG: 4-alpha-glucanotransferase, partial [Verrucomicrobiota bacterium]
MSANERTAGVLVPVFAIRRDDDLGIGDVAGVREMVDWAEQIGMRFLQFLPISEMGGDNSPYNAISSMAIEPLTIDTSPAAIKDLSQADFDKVLSAYDRREFSGKSVRYKQVRELKTSLLRAAFDHFRETHLHQGTKREEAFLAFCEAEKDWLHDYCVFRLYMDLEDNTENWEAWSENYNNIEKAHEFLKVLFEEALETIESELAWYAYVQWIALEQWTDVTNYAADKGVILMGDVPYGISRHSADVFANPELFQLDWCAGAPPEPTFQDDEFTMRWGQNWGFPLYDWDRMEQDDFAWWKRRVKRLCQVFRAFRIDHALGFYRIYSFPFTPDRNEEFLPLSQDEARELTGGLLPGFKPGPDDTEENQARNRECGEKYLGAIASAADGARIVAEDLGVVPHYMPDSLAKLGMGGIKVPMWSQEQDGKFVRGEHYPELSMATYATHDHAPIKTQWDFDRRIIAENDPPERVGEARHYLHRWARWAGYDDAVKDLPPMFGDSVREAFLKALFASKSNYASVMITDLLGLEDRFNTPGKLSDENWTHRLRMSVRELREDSHWSWIGER